MIRLGRIFSWRANKLFWLDKGAKDILNPPETLDSDLTRLKNSEVGVIFLANVTNSLKIKGDKVMRREAEAVSWLYQLSLKLKQARWNPSNVGTSLGIIVDNFINEGEAFTKRLENFKKALNEQYALNTEWYTRNICFSDENLPGINIIEKINYELGWLIGDDLERDFVAKNEITRFGKFQGVIERDIIDENGVCREFHPSIMDEIIILARSQNQDDEQLRSEQAKALDRLNRALVELDIYYHDAIAAGDRPALDKIIKAAQQDEISFSARLENIKKIIENPEVSQLIGQDRVLGRIVKEIISAIALFGIGYAFVKAYDTLWNGNSFYSCVFFKDPTHVKLEEALKPTKELLPSYEEDIESQDNEEFVL